jgi:methyl-accepting chemotaxis protein
VTRFSDLKISLKVVSLLLLLGLVSVLLIGFSISKMVVLDAGYSVLLDHKSPAVAMTIRANRRVSDMGYAAYRTITNPGASQLAQDAQKAVTEHGEAALRLLDDAKRFNPEGAAEYDRLKSELERVKAKVEEAAAYGRTDQNEAAAALMKEADQDIAQLSKKMTALNDASMAETEKLSAEKSKAVQTAITVVSVSGFLGIAGTVGLALWLTNSMISAPLRSLSQIMARLASGDLTAEVEGQARKDEVGDMARSVEVFRENGLKAREVEADASAQRDRAEADRQSNERAKEVSARELEAVMNAVAHGLERLSEGQLTFRINETFPEAYEALRRDFNGAIDKLEQTLKGVAEAAGAIGSGTTQISEAAEDLSKRTEQQAASLEETAAALDEITATVRKTADGAEHARNLVADAKASAERSGEVVGTAVAAMDEIESSARQISQIIGVIDEIAFQTNLLALNAGVEAARAGDAGKGFAVVASEVRALAQRSAEAAKDIKTLISSSSEQVSRGVDLVSQTGQALQTIVSQVGEITGIVSEIASSAQEQSTGLQQVNTAVNQMDQVTQQNAAMVEESTAASHALAGEATQLGQLMAQFTIAGGNPGKVPARGARTPAAPPRPAVKGQSYASGAATARKLDLASEPAAETASWEEF